MPENSPCIKFSISKFPFTLETDAGIKGIGAILSQAQEDGLLHPVAYAGRSLTAAERNHRITVGNTGSCLRTFILTCTIKLLQCILTTLQCLPY